MLANNPERQMIGNLQMALLQRKPRSGSTIASIGRMASKTEFLKA
jgi:hypothetical protein